VPPGVVTATWPATPSGGSLTCKDVEVADITPTLVPSMVATSLAALGENPVPVTVNVPSGLPTCSLRLLTAGLAGAPTTAKEPAAVTPATVTDTPAPAAPDGTVATISLAAADRTVAAAPPMVTDGAEPRPVP
jgi:hypothetical protein